MRARFGLIANTLDAYARAIDCYFSFLVSRESACETSTQADVTAWINQLRSRGLANETLIQRVTALRLFFEYLAEEGLHTDIPVSRGNAFRCYGSTIFRTAGPVRRLHQLPWIQTDEDRERLLRVTAEDCILDCVMLAESPRNRAARITSYTWIKAVERMAERGGLLRLTAEADRAYDAASAPHSSDSFAMIPFARKMFNWKRTGDISGKSKGDVDT